MRYFLIIVVLLLLAASIIMAIALGIGLSVGWLLTRILDFSLFEGTVLGLLALMIAGVILARLLGNLPDFGNDSSISDDLDYIFDREDEEYDSISATRFTANKTAPTWATWYQYIFANEIYHSFQDDPDTVRPLNDTQQKELAIRLADVTLEIVKAKPPSTRKLNITKDQFKRKMTKMGQKPYDDDILDLALESVNDGLDIYYDGVIEIIGEKKWDQRTEMFELDA